MPMQTNTDISPFHLLWLPSLLTVVTALMRSKLGTLMSYRSDKVEGRSSLLWGWQEHKELQQLSP